MPKRQLTQTAQDAEIEAAFAEAPVLAAAAEEQRLEIISRWITRPLIGPDEVAPSE